jgi:hypothetical protein
MNFVFAAKGPLLLLWLRRQLWYRIVVVGCALFRPQFEISGLPYSNNNILIRNVSNAAANMRLTMTLSARRPNSNWQPWDIALAQEAMNGVEDTFEKFLPHQRIKRPRNWSKLKRLLRRMRVAIGTPTTHHLVRSDGAGVKNVVGLPNKSKPTGNSESSDYGNTKPSQWKMLKERRIQNASDIPTKAQFETYQEYLNNWTWRFNESHKIHVAWSLSHSI